MGLKKLVCLLLISFLCLGSSFKTDEKQTTGWTKSGTDVVLSTPTDNVIHGNFTQLGSDAPIIRMQKFTGTAGATEGDTTTIIHGLTLTKIIGLQSFVTSSNSNLITPALVFSPEFQYDVFLTSTEIAVRLSNTNSGNLINGAITVLLTYEE